MEIRSRHVAHSVNALEEGFVDAVVSDDPQQVRVEQISHGSVYFAAFSGPSLELFTELIRAVLERVGQLIQAQKEVVLTAARGLDYRELQARRMRPAPRFDWANIYKARKRPKKAR